MYNRHAFFESHEALESLWLKTTTSERNFYKGLIQVAVAMLHWSRGNPSGALSLYQTSRRYLSGYRPDCCGLDVEAFLNAYDALFRDWKQPPPFAPERVPVLKWKENAVHSI